MRHHVSNGSSLLIKSHSASALAAEGRHRPDFFARVLGCDPHRPGSAAAADVGRPLFGLSLPPPTVLFRRKSFVCTLGLPPSRQSAVALAAVAEDWPPAVPVGGRWAMCVRRCALTARLTRAYAEGPGPRTLCYPAQRIHIANPFLSAMC